MSNGHIMVDDAKYSTHGKPVIWQNKLEPAAVEGEQTAVEIISLYQPPLFSANEKGGVTFAAAFHYGQTTVRAEPH